MSIRDIPKHEFESLVLNSDDFTLVDFYAPWCKPCAVIGEILSNLNVRYKGTLKIYKVNVDDEPELAKAFGVQSIPFIGLFYKGKLFNKIVGSITENDLLGKIEQTKKMAGVK